MSQTYLYIKQHSLTEKFYFGKTVKDPIKYNGSGKHWLRHLKVHGFEHVVTLWYELFTDQEECTKFALEFSEKMGIVKSDQWLNLKPENGLDGGGSVVGTKRSAETCEKFSKALTGRKQSPEHIAAMVATKIGKKRSPFQKNIVAISRKLVRNRVRLNTVQE